MALVGCETGCLAQLSYKLPSQRPSIDTLLELKKPILLATKSS